MTKGGTPGDDGDDSDTSQPNQVVDTDVFEASPIGAVITDADGRLVRVNTAFADLVGRPRAELLGHLFTSLTSPDDVAPSMTVMQNLLSKRVDHASFDKHYVRPDGRLVAVEIHIRALTGTDGAITGFLSQAVDVGDRGHGGIPGRVGAPPARGCPTDRRFGQLRT